MSDTKYFAAALEEFTAAEPYEDLPCMICGILESGHALSDNLHKYVRPMRQLTTFEFSAVLQRAQQLKDVDRLSLMVEQLSRARENALGRMGD